MCGIIGILGKADGSPVAQDIVSGLKRLEYRGYDSAGIATLEKGQIVRRRAIGKLNALQSVLSTSPLPGTVGIGHTRWATHGGVTVENAHPHTTERLALVHNWDHRKFCRIARRAHRRRGHLPIANRY